MNGGCKSFIEFGNDWEGFLRQDANCVFTKGACLAFAVELHRFLSPSLDQGAVRLFALRGKNPAGGDHVVIGLGDRFLDVTKTLMSADALNSWGVPEPTSIGFLLKEHDYRQYPCCFPAPLVMARKGTVDPMVGINEKMLKARDSKKASGEDDAKEISSHPCNGFGHRIDKPFFARACEMARSCIESNNDAYLRLAHEAMKGSAGD